MCLAVTWPFFLVFIQIECLVEGSRSGSLRVFACDFCGEECHELWNQRAGFKFQLCCVTLRKLLKLSDYLLDSTFSKRTVVFNYRDTVKIN